MGLLNMDNKSTSSLPHQKICGTAYANSMSLKDKTLIFIITFKSFISKNKMNISLCLIILALF